MKKAGVESLTLSKELPNKIPRTSKVTLSDITVTRVFGRGLEPLPRKMVLHRPKSQQERVSVGTIYNDGNCCKRAKSIIVFKMKMRHQVDYQGSPYIEKHRDVCGVIENKFSYSMTGLLKIRSFQSTLMRDA